MDCRIGDLRYKEVINVNTGYRLGFVSDGVFDVSTGQMKALVVPGQYKVMKPKVKYAHETQYK